MGLVKRTYIDGETVITADNLNDIQDEIIQNASDISTKGTYSKPTGGIPKTDLASSVQDSLDDADTAYQKPQAGIPDTDLASSVQTSLGKADTAYQKPSGGIPSTDMASAVQTSLGKADTAYQKPSGGIPSTDLASAVQTSLGKADTAYQKPSGGIPSTDLASAVQTSLGKANTALQSSDIDSTLTVSGKAADAKKTGDEISGLKNTFNTTNDINNIPQNIDLLFLNSSQVANAASKGVSVTKTGRNKIKLNGTASADFYIDIDFTDRGFVEVNNQQLYFIIKRSDGLVNIDDSYLNISYFILDGSYVGTNDRITMFNTVVPYSYASEAVYARNFMTVKAGSSFDNVEFEFIILESKPLPSYIKDGMLANRFIGIPLAFESKTGFYGYNGVFNTYSRIWGATVLINPNYKYRISYQAFFGVSEVVFFDAEDTFIIGYTAHNDSEFYTYDFYPPTNAVKMLVQAHGNNYENPSSYDDVIGKTYLFVEDGTVIKSDSVLYGRKIAYNGDSICESRLTGTASNGGGFPYLIAQATNGTYENLAVSGGTLASAVPGGTTPHSVSGTVKNMPTDADLYCFEGGINDFWNNVPLGDYSPTNYKSTLDTTTVCGALEYIFREAIYEYNGKPIVFVFVHKPTGTINANSAGYTFDQMREKMIGICHKYAIPFYDAYTQSGLNGYNDKQNVTFLTGNSTGVGDGIHPNKACYIRYYVPQLIKLFESLIPVNEE